MRRLAIVTVLVGLAAGLTALPAEAADSTTTFELTTAGGLSISAPGSKSLGSAATNAGTLSTQLGTVTVTDERGVLSGTWTASVSGTDFTTGTATADETIAKAGISYWSGAATASSGTMVAVPGQLTSLNAVTLGASGTAFSATGVIGNVSLSFSPTIVVNIPSDAVVGTYTGTITHSVA